MTKALRHPAGQAALFLLIALFLRFDTLGDPNLHGDEVFYQTVGVAMHHGAIPYVDVWDRKPFGLFALSWLVAGVSQDMLAFQIAALLCAAGTAWCIARIVEALLDMDPANWEPSWRAPVFAGIAYLLWLAPLQGFGGQSPVFYNLFIAAASALVVRGTPALREGNVPRTVYLAMLLAGYGVTIKTSALFEAAFLGGWCLWCFSRSGSSVRRVAVHALGWAGTGALPGLVFAAVYLAIGHWPEYWHAMIEANVDKPIHWPTALARLKILALVLSPIALFAAVGFVRHASSARAFIAAWLFAAILGLCAVPNFYIHYGLPLLVVLCVAAAPLLARGLVGIVALAFLAFLSLTIASPFRYGHAERSARAIDTLAREARDHLGGGPLLLYDAPPQLYVRTGQPFITPLVFPTHLSFLDERNVSHLDTLAETRRVLALRPGAVVIANPLRNGPANEDTHKLVLSYIGRHCRLITIVDTPERQRTDRIAVWGDCRAR